MTDAGSFIAEQGKTLTWSAVKHLKGAGGVYAILLPTAWFSPTRVLYLHPPNGHKGATRIPFEFTVPELIGDGYGVVYVGKATKLPQRWNGHLIKGERKRGGQVKHGLIDCGLFADELAAISAVREHAKIAYTVLSGPEQCVNRDVLEMALCGRFGPPFNVKSER